LKPYCQFQEEEGNSLKRVLYNVNEDNVKNDDPSKEIFRSFEKSLTISSAVTVHKCFYLLNKIIPDFITAV